MSKLTAEQRARLPASAFADPEKRTYPVASAGQLRRAGVKDPVRSARSHARSALNRARMFGGAALRARVCRLIAKNVPETRARSCGLSRLEE